MSSQRPGDTPPQDEYDPLYLHALRETLVIVVLFAIFCAWAIFIYFTFGLRQAEPTSQVSTTLGMPTWVFLGIFVPWIAVDAVAVWFCFTYMKDDDLGEAHEGEDLAEQVEHIHEREAHHE